MRTLQVIRAIRRVIGGRHWEGDHKAGPTRRRAFHPYASVHEAHMFGHQGQPESRAGTRAPPARDRTAEESLEHLVALQGVDTRTVVFHADLHVPQTVHGMVRTDPRTVPVAGSTLGHTGSTVAGGQSGHADHDGPA